MNKPETDKIGLFGGTFDPVHIGHLIVAEWVQDALNLHKVFFIPNYMHPFGKRKNITSPEKRLHMLNLALQPFAQFEVCDYEIKKGGVSYSIDTIEYFQTTFPASPLYYFIGADNLPEFHRWHRYRDILEKVQLVVYDRKEGHLPSDLPAERILFLKTPLIEISSTLIRERIGQGHAVQTLLPFGVWQYIRDNKLYGMKEK